MGEHQYRYTDAQPTWANAYLWPALQRELSARTFDPQRAIDFGCGNGATSGMLASQGFDVTGIDTSETGITVARGAFPACRFEVASAYEPLAESLGTFPLVVNLEVIEHCSDPRAFVRTFYDLIEPGGVGFLSTPYHGYWKNLALAVTGKLDKHFTALWDGGHVKFFSIDTLGALLNEAGAKSHHFVRVGRIPSLAKSMVAVVEKP